MLVLVRKRDERIVFAASGVFELCVTRIERGAEPLVGLGIVGDRDVVQAWRKELLEREGAPPIDELRAVAYCGNVHAEDCDACRAIRRELAMLAIDEAISAPTRRVIEGLTQRGRK